MTFRIGDICLVRSLPDIDPYYHGRECTVLSGLVNRPNREGAWHRIELQGEDRHWYARPHVLKPLPPPDTKLASWDECPFRPNVVDLSAILDRCSTG